MNIKSSIATSDKSIVNPIIVNGEIVGYLPLEIPDDTEKILKKVEESRRRMEDKWDKVIDRREKARNGRILASKEDKNLHAINLIITYAEMAKSPQNLENGNDPTTFTIPYYYFNFEDSKLFTFFLDSLKNAGCFKTWTTNPFKDADNIEFIFGGVNSTALTQFKESMEIVKFPTGETVTYQNNVLFFKLGDGTPDSIDLKTAHESRKVFESLWELRKRRPGKAEFTPADILSIYTELHKRTVNRSKLTDDITHLKGKIKAELKERFILDFIKDKDMWGFVIS